MKKFSLFIVAILIAPMLRAQIAIGPQIGLNLASNSYSYEGGGEPDAKMRLAPIFGAALDVRLSENFSIQPKLLFIGRGGKSEFTVLNNTTEVTTTLNYLSIPIDLIYGFNVGSGQLQVFAGPVIDIGVGGNVEAGGVDNSVKFKSENDGTSQDAIVNGPLNFGLNFGLGYWIPMDNNALQISAGYFLGLTNLTPSSPNNSSAQDDQKVFNRGIEIKLAYLFGISE